MNLGELILHFCDNAHFDLRRVGPATYEAAGQFQHLQAGRLANVLGGVAELEGDTITIDGCEVELRLVARG